MKKTKTYRTGSRFLIGRSIYLLSQVGLHTCCLVKIDNGNRYDEPIEVGNSQCVTEGEIARMIGKDDVVTCTHRIPGFRFADR